MQVSLPIDVMWISKIKYDHKTLDKHTHDFYHMFYIRKGQGTMHVAGEDYTICENEVYFCPPGTYHGLIAQSDIPLSVIEIKFTVPDPTLANLLSKMQNMTKCKVSNLYIKLEELVMEALHKPMFYKEIVNTGFARILLELVRNVENPFTLSVSRGSTNNNSINNISNINNIKNNNEFKDIEGNNVVLEKVIEYMNSKYAENISLKSLVKIGSVSQAHLNKLFKETFNQSPMQYLINLRLDKAKELMMYSDFNISQISELVGFSSIHYFSRYFKKKENISPSEFRNGVKDNIFAYL